MPEVLRPLYESPAVLAQKSTIGVWSKAQICILDIFDSLFLKFTLFWGSHTFENIVFEMEFFGSR